MSENAMSTDQAKIAALESKLRAQEAQISALIEVIADLQVANALHHNDLRPLRELREAFEAYRLKMENGGTSRFEPEYFGEKAETYAEILMHSRGGSLLSRYQHSLALGWTMKRRFDRVDALDKAISAVANL
jgi:uncharacterized coiled-coil protein SlyX